jgi:hypothetical protein
MLVKQISVFVENKTGRLAELTSVLAANNIDMKACNIAETVDFGILRCIVPNPDEAVKVLNANGFNASTAELVAVAIENTPGGLDKVLKILAGAGIAVNYIYSTITTVDGEAVILVKVADPDKAIQVLQAGDVKLLGAADLF